MRKINFSILQAFLTLTLISPCTTPVTTSAFSKQKIHIITMADAWIPPIRQHGRGRNPTNRGGGGGRDDRLAPAARRTWAPATRLSYRDPHLGTTQCTLPHRQPTRNIPTGKFHHAHTSHHRGRGPRLKSHSGLKTTCACTMTPT